MNLTDGHPFTWPHTDHRRHAHLHPSGAVSVREVGASRYDYTPPDARTFEEMDADDAASEEAIREIALGLPGRPGVIR